MYSEGGIRRRDCRGDMRGQEMEAEVCLHEEITLTEASEGKIWRTCSTEIMFISSRVPSIFVIFQLFLLSIQHPLQTGGQWWQL